MKPRFPLSTKIFLLASGNFLLLALVVLAFARFEFDLKFDSLLVGPAKDRVVSIARQIALDLEETPPASRDELLQRYSTTYGVTFYLFEGNGRQAAGPRIEVPPAVREELLRPPPRADAPPPPGPGRRDPKKREKRSGRRPAARQPATTEPTTTAATRGRRTRARTQTGSRPRAPAAVIRSLHRHPARYSVGAGIPLHSPG